MMNSETMSASRNTLDDLIEQWEHDHPGWRVERHYPSELPPGNPAPSVVIQVREDATDDTLSGTGIKPGAALAEVNKTFERRSRSLR